MSSSPSIQPSTNPSHALQHDQFLLVAASLLQRFLLESTRADAKQRFRQLQTGRCLALQTVELEDKSRAQFGVSFDGSEFCGKLNFGAFRASVQTLIGNIGEVLREKREITTFSPDQGEGALLFGITGVTVEARQANVMVLGTEPDAQGRATILKLMYLDPTQFLSAQQQQG